MSGLTDFEVEQLDFLLSNYDKAGLTPKGKSDKLFKAGQKFNPKPATIDEINEYIQIKNAGRDESDQLPPDLGSVDEGRQPEFDASQGYEPREGEFRFIESHGDAPVLF